MIEGRISQLDLENRSAVIVEENGNQIQVNFALRTNVEVIEDETVGLMGGELEDLEEGYHVEIEVASIQEGKDPDELIRNNSLDWLDIISGCQFLLHSSEIVGFCVHLIGKP